MCTNLLFMRLVLLATVVCSLMFPVILLVAGFRLSAWNDVLWWLAFGGSIVLFIIMLTRISLPLMHRINEKKL